MARWIARTPMAANVQWDVAVKSGNDPNTGRAYTPLVRMLYNEQEIAFRSEMHAASLDGSTWAQALTGA